MQHSPDSHLPSRRHFLKAAASTALAAPFVTSGLRANPPSERLRHASFGASGMAGSDINSLARSGHFELVAIAEVDRRRAASIQKKFPKAKFYQDWRELLEKEEKNIDSVNVSTPDHMHGPIGLAAMDLGKHCYGQKPLAQNLRECRAMAEMAKGKKVMTQMGIQISSAFTERLAVQLVQDGTIGKVTRVHSFSNKKWGDLGAVPEREDPVPEGFDWDLWLGVAAGRPYIAGYYHPGNWRKRRDFGTGTFGDMGCHIFSGWYRALGLTAPVSVVSHGPASNEHNWAVDAKIDYVFPGDGVHPGRHRARHLVRRGLAPAGRRRRPGRRQGPRAGQHHHRHRWRPARAAHVHAAPVSRDKFQGFKYPKLEPRDPLPRICGIGARREWQEAVGELRRLLPARSPRRCCSAAWRPFSRARSSSGTRRVSR